MEVLSLKWATAWSIAGTIYPYGTPPKNVNEAEGRLEAIIRIRGSQDQLSQRLSRALARARGQDVYGPEPELLLGIPTLKNDEEANEIPTSVFAANPAPTTKKPVRVEAESGAAKVIVVGAVIFTLLGILPMPYGFYVLLRLCFCGALCWLSWQILIKGGGWSRAWLITSIPLIILYNPIIQIHLGSKFIWIRINVASVAVMWAMGFARGRRIS